MIVYYASDDEKTLPAESAFWLSALVVDLAP